MYILINVEEQDTPVSIITVEDMEKIHDVGISEWLGTMEVIDTDTQRRFYNDFQDGKVRLKSEKLVNMRQLGYKPSLSAERDIEDHFAKDFA